MKNLKKVYSEPKINIVKFECDDVNSTSQVQEFSQMPNYSSTQNFVSWGDIYNK